MEVNAIKDGNGNVVISEDSFEMLLACLDNQKFVGESPQNGDSLSVGEDNYWKGQEDIQNTIDSYNTECRKILHQKYIFETKNDGYYLTKKYEHQNDITPWSGEDVELVMEIFKNTTINIERPLRYDGDYLTISEDGITNRPWKKEEIEIIKKTFS